MLHPVLEVVPDRYVAEACNEAFQPDYTFYSTGPRDELGRIFPSEPAYITSILAAYFEPGGGIRRQLVGLDLSAVPLEDVAAEYQRLIGPLQRFMPDIVEVTDDMHVFDEEGGIQAFFAEQVERKGNKLLAAHMVAKVAANDRILSALGYPKSLSHDIPFRIRDYTLAVARIRELFRQTDSEWNKKIQPVLRVEERVKKVGAVVAASFLPEPQLLAQQLRQK